MLTPITSKANVRHQFRRFCETLRNGAKRIEANLGFQGATVTVPVYWRRDLGFWVAFADSHTGNRFWCPLGIQDPAKHDKLLITCQINVPFEGIDRRIAASFARDHAETVYVVHSGKIGGGRKGIGKESFWRLFSGKPCTVTCPDGRKDEVVLIGDVASPRLPHQVRHFVREVARIKDVIASDKPHGIATRDGGPDRSTTSFSPEFSGRRASWSHAGAIESSCDHGLVVNTLAKELRALGYTIGKDRNRDLFTVSRTRRMTCLFEAKTDLSTTNIYGAIGQLMFHSALESPSPNLVAVLPGSPSDGTRRTLERLQIKTLSYRWLQNDIVFESLRRLLLRMKVCP